MCKSKLHNAQAKILKSKKYIKKKTSKKKSTKNHFLEHF